MIIYSTSKKMVELRRLYRETESYRGFTLIEILVVVMLMGVMAALVAPNIRFGINPLKDTTNRVAGIFKLARVKAMSQTSAYRVRQDSVNQLKVERAKSCFDTSGWTKDISFSTEDLSLNEAEDIQGLAKSEVIQIISATATNLAGITATLGTTWSVCYDSRGVANSNVKLTIKNITKNQQQQIEVFSGGAIQVYDS